jgi:hypothetical protein
MKNKHFNRLMNIIPESQREYYQLQALVTMKKMPTFREYRLRFVLGQGWKLIKPHWKK